MENACYVNHAEFYVKNQETAIAFDMEEVQPLADKAAYDGKNTLVLLGINNTQFIVQNIVPEVRESLQKQSTIMVILRQKGEIQAAYSLKLETDNNLGFADTFSEQSQQLCTELETIVEPATC